jgi:hypothetical protein
VLDAIGGTDDLNADILANGSLILGRRPSFQNILAVSRPLRGSSDALKRMQSWLIRCDRHEHGQQRTACRLRNALFVKNFRTKIDSHFGIHDILLGLSVPELLQPILIIIDTCFHLSIDVE